MKRPSAAMSPPAENSRRLLSQYNGASTARKAPASRLLVNSRRGLLEGRNISSRPSTGPFRFFAPMISERDDLGTKELQQKLLSTAATRCRGSPTVSPLYDAV